VKLRQAPELPSTLRVFPLTGCILLPGNWLPLHVFEPRYRAMIRDALAADRTIGMIQPRVPAPDNCARVGEPHEAPELQPVGCAGRIEHTLPEPDGRFHILLQGVIRFRITRELPLQQGYRRFQVTYDPFMEDLREPERNLDASRILQAMEVLKESRTLCIEPGDFKSLSGIAVLNGLAAALPFAPAEKQALLEATSAEERERLLLALLAMGFQQGGGPRSFRPPSIH